MSAKLDFCVGCGGWIGADTGTMRQGPDGEAEIVCNDCLTLEQNRAALNCIAEHDCKSGMLDNG
jgi:hypothetical protein